MVCVCDRQWECCRLTVFCLPQADQTGSSLRQIDLALGVPLLQPMSPAPLPQATPTPSPIAVGLRAFRGPFLEAHGESGSSSNRAPSFKSYLFGRPAPQQLDPVDEDRSVPSSAEGENVGVPGRAGAESPSNPRQRVGQQTPSSDRSPHTRAGRDRQELSVAAPSSNGSTTGQQQREGRGQTDGIALREPYGKDGKVLGSSQGASKTASSSNVSSRLGLIPDEVIHGLEEPLRNSGSHQSSQVQGKPGSTAPSLRAATRASSEVDRLVFVGEWLSGGKSRGRVPPARSQAAAVQRPDLRQTASTAASDGKLQKADRPDQPPARPTHTRSSDSGRRTSQALSSASLQTAHGRLVDWTTGVKPVQVSETPGPVRGEVFPRPAPQASPKPSPPNTFQRPAAKSSLFTTFRPRAQRAWTRCWRTGNPFHRKDALGEHAICHFPFPSAARTGTGVTHISEQRVLGSRPAVTTVRSASREFQFPSGPFQLCRRHTGNPRRLSPDSCTPERFQFFSGDPGRDVAVNPGANVYATGTRPDILLSGGPRRSSADSPRSRAYSPRKQRPASQATRRAAVSTA